MKASNPNKPQTVADGSFLNRSKDTFLNGPDEIEILRRYGLELVRFFESEEVNNEQRDALIIEIRSVETHLRKFDEMLAA